MPLSVRQHKPMKAFIPDDVILCKPIEVGVGVQSGVHVICIRKGYMYNLRTCNLDCYTLAYVTPSNTSTSIADRREIYTLP